MNNKNGASAPTGSACPKKATELFFVHHPKVTGPLLGPFLTAAEAELASALIASADATVQARALASADDFVHGHTINNGQIGRALIGIARQWRRV
ncbi:hypothetical protein ASF84_23670 [Pseudomonas sp. Leaf127]|uniref:hypothetical protein n=1 Tax=Pseudomonas sp. Leaf127 TaxID=1736267 RepID=UPI0007039545|nr:hypothetical protein [Pseudomonas sp. Leaf127]KQQ49300.1 hypothetical protein ASF84_23670 [Pseudomonas sp. Leaf127]